MSDMTFALSPQTEAEYEKVFSQIMADIERLNAESRQDQIEIDRFKAESALYKAQSQQLKAEGAQLDADIRARLDGLHAALDRMTGGV